MHDQKWVRLGEPDRLKLEAPPDDAKHCRSGAGSAIFFQAPYLSLVSRAQTLVSVGLFAWRGQPAATNLAPES